MDESAAITRRGVPVCTAEALLLGEPDGAGVCEAVTAALALAEGVAATVGEAEGVGVALASREGETVALAARERVMELLGVRLALRLGDGEIELVEEEE